MNQKKQGQAKSLSLSIRFYSPPTPKGKQEISYLPYRQQYRATQT